MPQESGRMDRRGFLKGAAAGLGAVAAAQSVGAAGEKPASGPAEEDKDKDKSKELIWRSKVPTMEYRRLGRTNYMVSGIVAGIGGEPALWRRMLANGMNYFDTAWGYANGNHERELGPFFKANRDKLWITSKATGVAGFDKVDEGVAKLYRKAMKDFIGADQGNLLELHHKAVEKQKATGEKPDLRPAGKRIADLYSSRIDESLGKMGVDHVDAYFMHGVEIPWMFDCLEVWEAYEKAHQAGKAKHFGISIHGSQKDVLAAAIEANKRGPWKIDVVMPRVNPESFDSVKPELAALKQQDVGIIAMKTKGIANRPVDGREKKFESLAHGKSYNEWERAKLWMLHLTEGLIDACIAAMSSNEEMTKDLALPSVKLSAAARRELRAIVKYEMAGVCHLCGVCDTSCPENIAVSDMIRYHAYIHQYNDKELARQLYALAGYDPARVCTNCGLCMDACPGGVPITQYLQALPRDLA